MRKSVRQFTALFIILVFGILQLSVVAFAQITVPEATTDFYVNDFANIFSEEEKEQLMTNAVTLANDHDGIQVVVTTVETLGGNTVEDYANSMYNQYGIGKDDMGLLILLSTGDRQIRVEVGRAMEAYITDAKAGRLIDKHAIPALKQNDFSGGLISLQEAVIGEITTNTQTIQNAQVSAPKEPFDFVSILPQLVMFLLVLLVTCGIGALIYQSISYRKKQEAEIQQLKFELEKSGEVNEKAEKQFQQRTRSLQEKIDELTSTNRQLKVNFQTLQSKYDTLSDRYQRVQVLFPSADQDVTSMIEEEIRQHDMAVARQADEVIGIVLRKRPSKDIVCEVAEALSVYMNLTQSQKSYVHSDISKLQSLHDASVSLKKRYEEEMEEKRRKEAAAIAIASITAIISCIYVGKASNLRKLKEAKDIYDRLDSGTRSYFDSSVASKLDTLYQQAKRDQEEEERRERERRRREEEEERERRRHEEERRRSSYSSSSFGSSSHHSGFGGRSGGGGASRGF